MRRVRKGLLMVLRYTAYRLNINRMYYWAEKRMFELRSVKLLPDGFYCFMYRVCMKLVDERKFLGLADWMIHRIPYDVRCNLA